MAVSRGFFGMGGFNFVGAAGLTRWLVPLRDASNSGSDRYARLTGASQDMTGSAGCPE